MNHTINSSKIGITHLQNCKTLSNNTSNFDLKCLTFLINIKQNSRRSSKSSKNPRRLSKSSISFYLISNLSSNFNVLFCGKSITLQSSIISRSSTTSLQFIGTYCQKCDPDHEDIHCKSLINYCSDIISQNNKQYQRNFTYECTKKRFSIYHCKVKHSLHSSNQRINHLFTYIIISIVVFIPVIITLMDVLKYSINTSPVKKESQQKKQMMWRKEQKPTIIRRFIYSRRPKLETILEENEI